jgi:serine/threonine-protein kinase SRPK3
MLSQNNSSHPGGQHIVRLLDDFPHTGPNGTHTCLVFELLGHSFPTVTEERFADARLPGVLAKRVCKEMLLAVDFLHKQGIGHGGQSIYLLLANTPSQVKKPNLSIDLHTGNIAFSLPPLDSLSEETLLNRLGSPRTDLVSALDRRPLPPGMPKYLVWPANIPLDKSSLEAPIKLIDFGESFLPDYKPQTLHTPLALRAPELLLGENWDARADLWTLGCTVSATEQS